jgi:integrase
VALAADQLPDLLAKLQASAYCRDHDLTDPITMLIATGLRHSDLLGLRWSDIGTARGMCTALQYGVTSDQEAIMTSNNTGLTPGHARAVVNAAIAAYCPQYGG